ncbi:MAG: nucleotidyltransferase domain-containing protein [Gemmatimonadota bacterium]
MIRDTSSQRATALAELAEEFELADIYVFGSRETEFVQAAGADGGISPRLVREGTGTDARPTTREPDVDIGVRSIRGRRLTARRRAELVVALEDLFDIPRVDLVIVPEAPPFLALAVISGELLYCRDATDQAEYELYVLRRAGDLAPFERERRAHILGDT